MFGGWDLGVPGYLTEKRAMISPPLTVWYKHFAHSHFYRLLPKFIIIAWTLSCFGFVHADENPPKNYRLKQLNPIANGLTAPDLSLPDTKGTEHRISHYRGHVTVVNFWSTWCIPCREEMPSLENAWQRVKPSGIIVLAVAMQDDLKSIELFLKDSAVSFPVLLDSEGTTAAQWQVVGIPTTFILDTSGQIVFKAVGIRTWDSDKIVNKLLQLSRVK
jgi:peroxiredoxin